MVIGRYRQGETMTDEFIGTESLLDLSRKLVEHAPLTRQAIHLGECAYLMECAAEAIKRLAPMEPDMDVTQGEN